MNYVIKRDGRRRKFNEEKIKTAVLAAFNDVDGEISDYAVEKAAAKVDMTVDEFLKERKRNTRKSLSEHRYLI